MEGALLEDAQELALRGRRELADLVEKDRAGIAELELAQPAARGAGERSALVAEELALEKRLGNGGAVDGDERAAAPGRERVDRPGEELLARAALALEQHGGVRGRDALGLGPHRPDGGRFSDDRRHRARLRVGEEQRLAGLRPPLDGPGDQQTQEVRVHGLGDEVLGAALHRFDGRLDGAEGGHDEHRQRGVVGPRGVEDREAVGARQAPVGQDQIEAFSRRAVARPPPSRSRRTSTRRPSAFSISSSIVRSESLSSTIRMRDMISAEYEPRIENRASRFGARPPGASSKPAAAYRFGGLGWLSGLVAPGM